MLPVGVRFLASQNDVFSQHYTFFNDDRLIRIIIVVNFHDLLARRGAKKFKFWAKFGIFLKKVAAPKVAQKYRKRAQIFSWFPAIFLSSVLIF